MKKSKNIININRALWGFHGVLIPTHYLSHSTLGSSIEYGGQFFTWNTKSANFIKLLRIQYKAIRKAMGHRIFTPINTMLYEVKINLLYN